MNVIVQAADESLSMPGCSQAVDMRDISPLYILLQMNVDVQAANGNLGMPGCLLAAGMRNIDPLYKLQMNIKIAMLFLEDDDPVSAEMFIKKASSLIAHSKV
eukprot:scaffold252988_cov16-Tisochrysis_lutea.AAC.2